jgi:hypothetical protein
VFANPGTFTGKDKQGEWRTNKSTPVHVYHTTGGSGIKSESAAVVVDEEPDRAVVDSKLAAVHPLAFAPEVIVALPDVLAD